MTEKELDWLTDRFLREMTEDDLEYAAPGHNRQYCTCPYCEELRARENDEQVS